MLISLALDFRRADLRTRERFYLTDERVDALYQEARGDLVQELALVSTCNRIELYAWSPARAPAEFVAALSDLARRWMGDDSSASDLIATATHRQGADVSLHLCRVAAGLESQVLGDAQILGQVRRAYRRATEAGVVGAHLHRLFDAALRAGKRVQRETSLVGGKNSIGAMAASVAARRLGPLVRRRCVVLGCGKTGARAARALVKLGAADVVLINRTPQRAHDLAEEVWGRAAPFDALHREIAQADVAIVATGAERPPVRASSLRFCREMAGTQDHELLILDLSLPRNVEPEVVGLPGVSLVDLDHLNPPLAAAEQARRDAVPAAERIVEQELCEFDAWLRQEPAREAIRPLCEALVEVCRREVGHAAGADIAERAAERIVAKLMARPMLVLRHAHERGHSTEALTAALQSLFADEEFLADGAARRGTGTHG